MRSIRSATLIYLIAMVSAASSTQARPELLVINVLSLRNDIARFDTLNGQGNAVTAEHRDLIDSIHPSIKYILIPQLGSPDERKGEVGCSIPSPEGSSLRALASDNAGRPMPVSIDDPDGDLRQFLEQVSPRLGDDTLRDAYALLPSELAMLSRLLRLNQITEPSVQPGSIFNAFETMLALKPTYRWLFESIDGSHALIFTGMRGSSQPIALVLGCEMMIYMSFELVPPEDQLLQAMFQILHSDEWPLVWQFEVREHGRQQPLTSPIGLIQANVVSAPDPAGIIETIEFKGGRYAVRGGSRYVAVVEAPRELLNTEEMRLASVHPSLAFLNLREGLISQTTTVRLDELSTPTIVVIGPWRSGDLPLRFDRHELVVSTYPARMHSLLRQKPLTEVRDVESLVDQLTPTERRRLQSDAKTSLHTLIDNVQEFLDRLQMVCNYLEIGYRGENSGTIYVTVPVANAINGVSKSQLDVGALGSVVQDFLERCFASDGDWQIVQISRLAPSPGMHGGALIEITGPSILGLARERVNSDSDVALPPAQ